ncbi:hypothetical protein F5Y18DRAFT_410735 [Xylariaceae sp. FL1019]|nr:hypothetical protein F5Y18DRAFT_410735 [Xylariaceae sp. FL1019]
MNFTGSFLPNLGMRRGVMSSLIPQHVSPPLERVDNHDLAELSPRPEHALGESDHSLVSSTYGNRDGSRRTRTTGNVHRRAGNGKKTSVTIQEPPRSPSSAGDATANDYEPGKRMYQSSKSPEVWRPSDPYQRSPHNGPQLSFFESIFMPRPTYSDRSPSAKVDKTFETIERQERSLEKQLQRLLNAQDYALEKSLANDEPEDSVSRSSTPDSVPPKGHVVPVRQPRKRHLSTKEARVGISHCLSQLSNLKNEEDAYIATALAERKSALSRLRNLSSKRSSIVTQMQAMESDQPLKSEIQKMEDQHTTVCSDIEKLERQLRDLKQKRTRLEHRISEAKSRRESELSGYAGALKDCDKRIKEIMDFPSISILGVEGLLSQDADLMALVGDHMSGLEFLSLRPERRTLPMAKDWWEGEIEVLELRKTAVDRERSALDEGAQLWADVIGRLEAHDQHLSLAMTALASYAARREKRGGEAEGTLKKQYELTKSTTTDLEDLKNYTEAQGWNLLAAGLGAELNYITQLKASLADTLRVVGWADGVVTPRPSTPTRKVETGNLIGTPEQAQKLEEDLTGSVIRRWDGTEESANTNNPPADLLVESRHHESDNEVPPGLLSEVQGSEDEHNDIPPEFLSMHSPKRNRGKDKAIINFDPPMGVKHEDVDEHHELSRESSANEVPPDLLAESHLD